MSIPEEAFEKVAKALKRFSAHPTSSQAFNECFSSLIQIGRTYGLTLSNASHYRIHIQRSMNVLVSGGTVADAVDHLLSEGIVLTQQVHHGSIAQPSMDSAMMTFFKEESEPGDDFSELNDVTEELSSKTPNDCDYENHKIVALNSKRSRRSMIQIIQEFKSKMAFSYTTNRDITKLLFEGIFGRDGQHHVESFAASEYASLEFSHSAATRIAFQYKASMPENYRLFMISFMRVTSKKRPSAPYRQFLLYRQSKLLVKRFEQIRRNPQDYLPYLRKRGHAQSLAIGVKPHIILMNQLAADTGTKVSDLQAIVQRHRPIYELCTSLGDGVLVLLPLRSRSLMRSIGIKDLRVALTLCKHLLGSELIEICKLAKSRVMDKLLAQKRIRVPSSERQLSMKDFLKRVTS